MPEHARTWKRVAAAIMVLLLGLVSCSDVVTVVEIARVDIVPSAANVSVGGSTRLTARLLGPSGETLSGRSVSWRTLDPDIAQVEADGTVRGIVPGSAIVEASSGDVSGTAEITVAAGPRIAIEATEVEVIAVANGVPAERTVSVQNAGGGSLAGLSAAVRYADGAPGGWLSASITPTAPAALVLGVDHAGLAAGSYTGLVDVAASVADNSPVTLTVRLTVAPALPAISVTPTSLEFSGRLGAADPGVQTVQITNAGGGTLTGLTTSATYPGGQAGGWLSLNLDRTTAPATLSAGVRMAGLTPGTYAATISIAGASAVNSPRTVDVALHVGEAAPVLVASPAGVSLTSLSEDDASPPPVAVALGNGGGGSLTDLVATVSYASGGTTGWLNAVLDDDAAPTTLTVAATRGALPVGTHRATVRVTATDAEPLDIPVQYVIAVVAPAAPTAAIATPESHARIRLDWTHDGTGVERFEIDRSTNGGASWSGPLTALAEARNVTDAGLTASTTYTYGVRACNVVGCSPRSALVAARTAPAPPTDLAASATAPDRVALTWTDASSDESGFVVERSTDGASWVVAGQVSAAATAFTDSGRTPATTYRYRVRACRAGLCSGPGDVAVVTTPVAAPGVPGSLIASAVDNTAIELNWTSSSGVVDGYHIERSTTSGGGFAAVDSVAAGTTSFLDTGLESGTTYYYRVRARNASAFSSYSAVASASTPVPPPPVPGAPADLSASATDGSTIELNWTASSGTVDGYHIERSTTPGGGFAAVDSVAAGTTSFLDTGLESGTTYYYRVRARNVSGFSSYSAVASASTPVPPPPVPGAPADLGASATGETAIELSWTTSSGTVDGYHIERSTTSGGGFAAVDTVAAGATSFLDTGLESGTTYYYRVRARNVSGFSSYSAEASTTTPMPPPPPVPGTPRDPAASAIDESTIELTWAASTGVVDSYHIERRSGSGGFMPHAIVAGTETSYLDTGLEAGTTYSYRVRASNVSGFSSSSSVASATTHSSTMSIPGGSGQIAATAEPDKAAELP